MDKRFPPELGLTCLISDICRSIASGHCLPGLVQERRGVSFIIKIFESYNVPLEGLMELRNGIKHLFLSHLIPSSTCLGVRSETISQYLGDELSRRYHVSVTKLPIMIPLSLIQASSLRDMFISELNDSWCPVCLSTSQMEAWVKVLEATPYAAFMTPPFEEVVHLD